MVQSARCTDAEQRPGASVPAQRQVAACEEGKPQTPIDPPMPRVLQAEYPLQGLQVLVGKVGEIEVETLIQKLIDANPNAQGQSRTTVSPEVQEKGDRGGCRQDGQRPDALLPTPGTRIAPPGNSQKDISPRGAKREYPRPERKYDCFICPMGEKLNFKNIRKLNNVPMRVYSTNKV